LLLREFQQAPDKDRRRETVIANNELLTSRDSRALLPVQRVVHDQGFFFPERYCLACSAGESGSGTSSLSQVPHFLQ
jgi:hypothetical protein